MPRRACQACRTRSSCRFAHFLSSPSRRLGLRGLGACHHGSVRYAMALGGRSRSRRPRTTATRYGRLSSQRNLDRRAKISVTLMPANATPSKCPDGPISGARRQGTLCRAHAHRASMPASCILPRTEIQSKLYAIVANRRKLAHSRSLCVARRAASSRGM